MAVFTLSTGGLLFDVLEGELTLALTGAPVATLELPEDTAPEAGPADILVAQGDDEPVRFVGTISRARAYEGRVTVVWVGGAGGLGGETLSTHYAAITRDIERADLVADIVASAGEQLDGEALATGTLPRWTRLAGETWAQALDRALEGTGATWRVLDTGRVWVGVDTWPELASLDGGELDEDKTARVLHVGYDRATVRPGTTYQGRRIARVTYSSDGHAELALERDGASLRRLGRLLARHVPADPYAREWRAEVLEQHDDETLDLGALPEQEGIPFDELLRVPFDTGVQGARYVLPKSAHVSVVFIGARPDGAMARGRSTSAAADRGVARFNDHCKVGTLTLSGTPAGLIGVYTSPTGNAQNMGTITGAVGASPVVFAGILSATLEALIDTASEEVYLQ